MISFELLQYAVRKSHWWYKLVFSGALTLYVFNVDSVQQDFLCVINAGSEFLFPTLLQDLPLPDVFKVYIWSSKTKEITTICGKEVLHHPHQYMLIFSLLLRCVHFFDLTNSYKFMFCSQQCKTVNCIDTPAWSTLHIYNYYPEVILATQQQ